LPVTPVWPVPKHFQWRIVSGANPITAPSQIQSLFFMVINKAAQKDSRATGCQNTIIQL
jgi:hypothetical protein